MNTGFSRYQVVQRKFYRCECSHNSNQPYVHIHESGKSDCQISDFEGALCLNKQSAFLCKTIEIRELALDIGPATRYISLASTKISKENLSKLCTHLTSLRYVDLSYCKQIGDSVGRILSECCGYTLKSVRLKYCNVSKESIYWISGKYANVKCRVLTAIDISFCSRVCDQSLKVLASGCRDLQYLNISGCKEISNQGMASIKRKCHKLRSLNLSSCPKLNDKALTAISTMCPLLHHLDLSSCVNISDQSIKEVTKLSHLLTLNLNGAINVTEASLYEIGIRCRSLALVDVTGCKEITRNGLVSLIEGLGYVREAHNFFGFTNKRGIKCRQVGKLRNQSQEVEKTSRSSHPVMKQSVEEESSHQHKYAVLIQKAYDGFRRREQYIKARARKVTSFSAITIQKFGRCWLQRNSLNSLQDDQRIKTKLSYLVQKRWRGYSTRVADQVVASAIQRHRLSQEKHRVTTLIQKYVRRYLAILLKRVILAEILRKASLRKNLYLFLCHCYRVNLCKCIIKDVAEDSVSRSDAANIILNGCERFINVIAGRRLLQILRNQRQASIQIQTVLRKACVRISTDHLMHNFEILSRYSIAIQRIFRGYFVRENRMSTVLSYVQYKHLEEHRLSLYNAALRLKCEDTDFPNELSLRKDLPIYCQVYWPKNKTFFEGIIESFDEGSNLWKLVYLDGDFEWIDLSSDVNASRIFVYQHRSNSWEIFKLSMLPRCLGGCVKDYTSISL